MPASKKRNLPRPSALARSSAASALAMRPAESAPSAGKMAAPMLSPMLIASPLTAIGSLIAPSSRSTMASAAAGCWPSVAITTNSSLPSRATKAPPTAA